MVRHFLSISITSDAIAVAIADIDMPLSLTMLDDLLRLSITLTINNDEIAGFHLLPGATSPKGKACPGFRLSLSSGRTRWLNAGYAAAILLIRGHIRLALAP